MNAVVAGVTELLNSHPDVDQKLPHGAGLAGYTDYAIEIGMLVRAEPSRSTVVCCFTTWSVIQRHSGDFTLFCLSINYTTR